MRYNACRSSYQLQNAFYFVGGWDELQKRQFRISSSAPNKVEQLPDLDFVFENGLCAAYSEWTSIYSTSTPLPKKLG